MLLSVSSYLSVAHGDLTAPFWLIWLVLPTLPIYYMFGLLPAVLCTVISSVVFHFIARRETRISVAPIIGLLTGWTAVLAYDGRVLNLGSVPWQVALTFCVISAIVSTIGAIMIERLGTPLPHAS